MSMTAFQLEGLRLLGYSDRESEFLFLVATHSGYFTNHQFKSFVHTESSSVTHAFSSKLLDRKHATHRAYRSGERVYHLFARKMYQAIERENLRTRKKHELEYVKTRLVALDFVIAHHGHRYLATETEKVDFFEKERGLSRSVLPVKLYRARRCAEVTPRHFVDRFPLFLDGTSGVLTFTYIDSGTVTLDGFRTHLRAYLGLFQMLPAFNFIYVAPTSRLFRAAESEFQKIVPSRRSSGKSVSVLEYFRLRRAWVAKERVASEGVVLLKEAQGLYTGNHYEELYERWRNGNAKDDEVINLTQGASEPRRIAFRTLFCGVSLKVFTDSQASSSETLREQDVSGSSTQISEPGSIEIPGS